MVCAAFHPPQHLKCSPPAAVVQRTFTEHGLRRGRARQQGQRSCRVRRPELPVHLVGQPVRLRPLQAQRIRTRLQAQLLHPVHPGSSELDEEAATAIHVVLLLVRLLGREVRQRARLTIGLGAAPPLSKRAFEDDAEQGLRVGVRVCGDVGRVLGLSQEQPITSRFPHTAPMSLSELMAPAEAGT